jgi:hypothetical protein
VRKLPELPKSGKPPRHAKRAPGAPVITKIEDLGRLLPIHAKTARGRGPLGMGSYKRFRILVEG